MPPPHAWQLRSPAVELSGGTFLVTGGAGFVGSHVVDALVEAGAGEVVVLDRDLRDENLASALRSGRVRTVDADLADRGVVAGAAAGADGVFHLAVLPLGACIEDPRRAHDVNVGGTLNVLEAARAAGARKVVFSSASSVYGDTDETMDESHPLGARTMYGATKVAAEFYVRAFSDMYGLDYVTLRYMNVYGPRQEGGLVMSVLGRILSGERPSIAGDGSQSFDFVHVADIAGANLAAMASDTTGQELNVGSGTEASVREIVEKLLELTGSDLEPEYRLDERVLMRRRVGSSERAEQVLCWRASRDIEAGLRDVVESLALR
jgi:nucleoside-diphosphate-sugar epimerase